MPVFPSRGEPIETKPDHRRVASMAFSIALRVIASSVEVGQTHCLAMRVCGARKYGRDQRAASGSSLGAAFFIRCFRFVFA